MSKMSFDVNSKLKVFMNENFESEDQQFDWKEKKVKWKKSTKFRGQKTLSFFCFWGKKLLGKHSKTVGRAFVCVLSLWPLLLFLQTLDLDAKWTHRIFGVQLTHAKEMEKILLQIKHTDY